MAPLSMLILLQLSGTARAQECERATSTRDVARALNTALDAFFALDKDAFAASRRSVRGTLACLEEPVQRRQAADFHRVEALASYLDRDEDRVLWHLRAAHAIEPSYDISELIPQDHPIMDLEDRARSMGTPALEEVAAGGGLTAWWDGRPPAEWVAGWPGLLQVVDPRGDVVENAWVEPATDALPPGLLDSGDGGGVRPYASVGLGLVSVVNQEVVQSDLLSTWRPELELGVAWPRFSLGLAGNGGVFNGTPYELQAYDAGGIQTLGDMQILHVGPTVAGRVPVGPLELGLHGDAGLAASASKVDAEYYVSEILPLNGGQEPAIGRRASAPYLGAGLSVAPAQVKGRVRTWLRVGGDYALFKLPLLTVGAQLGVRAEF